jgi:peptidoglycan/xylan/chitin deacetylase (PgdA/CDA1 family)
MSKLNHCLLACLLAFESTAALEPGRLYTQGPKDAKQIALSFDDGPGPETPKVLNMLDRYGVKATFFVLGQAVSAREELLRDLAQRGHEVASHTTSHRNYLQHQRSLAAKNSPQSAEQRARQDLVADMRRTHSAIQQATGISVQLCRMPHGIDRPWIKEAARQMGYALVNWTYGADWHSKPAKELLPGYLTAVRPGAILLFHDGGRNRAKSLQLAEAVIRHAQAEGYRIVTVGQLLRGESRWKRDFQVGNRPATHPETALLTQHR